MKESLKLLRQIETDALDPKADLAQALRRVITLGATAGSERLREWASRELKGYENDADIPSYRQIVAQLTIDGVSGNRHIAGQPISAFELPEVARGRITEDVKLGMPMAELANTLHGEGESIKLQPPGGADLVLLMNAGIDTPYQHVERLYWQISKATVARVLDGIRTTLVELVAEIRVGLGGSEADEVSKGLADQAFNIAVHGDGNRIELGSVALASGQGQAKVKHRQTSRFGQRLAWIGGIGTLLTGIVAGAAFIWDVF